MSNQHKKYMNIDIVPFLEEKMKSNTKYYQTDFEYDKQMFEQSAKSSRDEDKTLIWMSRPAGTHCHRERESFIFDSSAHNTWRFYAEHTKDPIIACTVEITGMHNGKVLGNVYEMDYLDFATALATKSVLPAEYEKTFKDGYVAHVPLERSVYNYYSGLIDQHGEITYSRTIPKDSAALSAVLAEQKRIRDRMRPAVIAETKQKPSLASQIQYAESRTNKPAEINNGREYGLIR